MARFEGEPPLEVRRLADAVSKKLGRPAHFRKAVNLEDWYVQDPVFSFVQQGMKKGNTGYRVGYRLNLEQGALCFELVHSPLMAKLFKRNLVFSTLLEVIRATAKYRFWHRVYRSSKQAMRIGRNGEDINNGVLSRFLAELEAFDQAHGFIDDMFPRRANTGKGGGKAPVAGNDFLLLLADRVGKTLGSEEGVEAIVDLSWPLFLCLYPVKATEVRTAGLARNMRSKGIPRVCEFAFIENVCDPGISPLCRGAIQGAHIKPDCRGGSDRAENGIWLCEYHHRQTEGKLSGRRNGQVLEVRFVATD